MKTLSLWAAGVAAFAAGAAGPALACSPRFTPFSQLVDDADFAFHANARVRIDESVPTEDEEGGRLVSGTVRFRGIECYASPRGERHCPRSLTVPFTVVDDGYNCPSWVLGHRSGRDGYFTLWRDEDGRWQLGGAWQRFDRR